ncbi:IS200/IS605 family transposase [Shimazuella kribbensis]|uniref:IS200/IS605 family transposase n=1 Tax=Shimazuella kribbensis TaxID=139808 RepID=UPI0004203AAB|nr:IS200/IS605 family transposase [Shimazuella kribbensis]
MEQEYRKTRTTVSLINYHFVFCPRYRRKVLINKVEERFKQLVAGICQENDWIIVAMEVMPDHCHLFLNCLPTDSPSDVMARVKGVTSRRLRQEFKQLSHLPSLWTRSFFVSTAGNAKKLQAIKKSKDKESHWMKDQNHKIRRQIVNYAISNGVGVIRMEDLTDIRNTAKSKKTDQGRNLHSWSFYQLKEFIKYKAEMFGIRFELVNPEYTSQTCKNGHQARANRNGLKFRCKECGHACHADVNGAINIAKAISGLAS